MVRKRQKKKPKQVSLHIMFHKLPKPDAGSYDPIDKFNKVIGIDTTILKRKTQKFGTPIHEFMHFLIDYYEPEFNWSQGWPKIKRKDKREIICKEVEEVAWDVISKYLKKG